MSNLAKVRRVTLEQPFTMTIKLYPQDSEVATDPDGSPGAAHFTLVHVNGTVLVARAAATRLGAGEFSYTVPGIAQLCNAIATWDYTVGGVTYKTVQYVQVIQSHYIELADIRTLDGLNSATSYPSAILAEKRDNAEALFEMATGVFWTPHYVMDILDGDPNYRIALQSAVRDMIDYIPMKRLVLQERYPQQLLTLTLGGIQAVNNLPATGTVTAADASSFTDSAQTRKLNQDNGMNVNIGPDLFFGNIIGNTATLGTKWTISGGWYDALGNNISNGTTVIPTLSLPYTIPPVISADYLIYTSGEIEAQLGVAAFPRGMQNVQVEYIAGQQYMPADLWEALGYYIRYLVLHTNARIPDRATSMTTEFGTFRIGQATPWDHPTGLSEVDAVLMRYGERLPAFA